VGSSIFLGFLQVKPFVVVWEKNTILHAEVGKFACKPHAVKTRACWRQGQSATFEISSSMRMLEMLENYFII